MAPTEASISPDVIRGYVDTIILSVIWDAPSYGYSISRTIGETTGGAYTLKETTLYSALARLEKNGYVEPFPGEVTQGRPRTYFRITEAGRDFCRERRREWQFTQEIISRFTEQIRN
jgi:PadR family transcriptional regulator PadR